ncbi:tetratricopeptide repeat protein [Planktothrix sp. FACHB-1355]|uniref:Tetratricopeptide repeat protein n=1 Tax=Aerosakkonema funiforme FACHB-1375 TaxID=2949571 RepID=A0A926ZLA3_9CYAN|nr:MULTISPECIES: tetratricopeptide repeat protein [Oscillatoriales]MBD2184881.1 tetratricopeptide repeat protein [Aerosakkonema funiforme FACHB-1375]MBD3560420.1 tetratricopeptide repeat protein [Planktothrix sp. FACHB-1355]
MKLKFWLACAIVSVNINIAAVAVDRQNTMPALLAQAKGAPAISPTERQELQQLRLEKEIRDRVQAEVDRAFSRLTTSMDLLLFAIALFPVVTALAVWLLRRSSIDQIVSETRAQLQKEAQKQLTAEIADEFSKQSAIFTQEIENLEAKLIAYITSQTGAIYFKEQEDVPIHATANLPVETEFNVPNIAAAIEIEADNSEAQERMPAQISNEQFESGEQVEDSLSVTTQEVLNANDYLERGNEHFAAGRYVEANNSYNQAVKLDRDLPSARYQNARAYAMRGSINAAVGNLQWAIDVEPTYKEMAKSDSAFDEIRESEQFHKVIEE